MNIKVDSNKLSEEYFKIDLEKTNNKMTETELKELEEKLIYTNRDYLLPLHTVLKVKEKLHEEFPQYYLSNKNYWDIVRYRLLLINNKQHHDIKVKNRLSYKINNIEAGYFRLNTFIMLFGLGMIIGSMKKLWKFRFFTGLIGLNLMINSKYYSLFWYYQKINEVYSIFENEFKEKIEKLKYDNNYFYSNPRDVVYVNEYDVLDETSISDLKSYLYYYGLY